MHPVWSSWRRLVSAALLLVIAGFPGMAYGDGPRVAVFPVKNNGQAQYTGLSSGLAAMITNNLNRSEVLDVVEPQAVLGALVRARLTGGAPSVDEALRAADKLGADYAVTGSFLMFGGKFRIDLTVYDVKKGGIGFADKAQASEDAFFEKVDELSDRIIIKLAGSLPKPKGSLTVSSDPPGAAITLDGEDAGSSPATFEKLEPGDHTVELSLYGYKPFSDTVTVKEGEAVEFAAKLVPLNGGLRVWWSDTPSSDVQIGPDLIGAANFRFDPDNPPRKYCLNLPAGTYRVSVRMPFKDEGSWDTKHIWKTYTADVDVRPGEVSDVYIHNRLFSPSLDVSTCASCEDTWDFDTDIKWFESVY